MIAGSSSDPGINLAMQVFHILSNADLYDARLQELATATEAHNEAKRQVDVAREELFDGKVVTETLDDAKRVRAEADEYAAKVRADALHYAVDAKAKADALYGQREQALHDAQAAHQAKAAELESLRAELATQAQAAKDAIEQAEARVAEANDVKARFEAKLENMRALAGEE